MALTIIIHFEDNTQLILNHVINRKIDHEKYFIKCKDKNFEFDTNSVKYVDVKTQEK